MKDLIVPQTEACPRRALYVIRGILRPKQEKCDLSWQNVSELWQQHRGSIGRFSGNHNVLQIMVPAGFQLNKHLGGSSSVEVLAYVVSSVCLDHR